jgi:hydrogenase maturation protein HypF
MERRTITIFGIVQGVGFRPFVFRLATEMGLSGFVRNAAGCVSIEIEGPTTALDEFVRRLHDEAPRLSRIESIEWHNVPVRNADEFSISHSLSAAFEQPFISPDVAVCADCISELFDPNDRRFRYPFLNCTNCGPRLTIICGSPYDRAQTTMSEFPMCAACRCEYEDSRNRRFHAQPTACPQCGPQLEIVDAKGSPVDAEDPLAVFGDVITRGGIGALKGLGGYHLCCDASNQSATAELRRRKLREEMPLAIMVGNTEQARELCDVSPAEQALLESSRRPIVLLRRRSGASQKVCEAVAPGNPVLGVMLPYTPLHYLLLDRFGNLPLVMTSGNRHHEPIAYCNDDAVVRLGGIADVILRHDREIHVRCDDSVTRICDGQELPVRRSRGYAPQPLHLPLKCGRPMLAVGGQLKGAFALGSDSHAFLSHHLGDLDQLESCQQFERDIALYEELFHIHPEIIVHDLHPDYVSTNYAIERAKREGHSTVGVQHHHAHMASCMAEHGVNETVIGVTFDGTGYGVDERTGQPTIWGGEFLIGDYSGFRRAAHLRYAALPGGEMAVRHPWRMAASYLIDACGETSLLSKRNSKQMLATVRQMIEQRLNSPLTSSAGRLFDAIAAIAGVRDSVSYEGQAAMQLEWLATGETPDGEYPFEFASDPASVQYPIVIDTRPMIRAVADDVRGQVAAGRIARRFHSTLIAIIADTCGKIRQKSGINVVVLSGGVFLNALLTSEVMSKLSSMGFEAHRHQLVPPNDGGLCLGQLAVAAARMNSTTSQSQTKAIAERLETCASEFQEK